MWIMKKSNVSDVRAINEFAESTRVYLLQGINICKTGCAEPISFLTLLLAYTLATLVVRRSTSPNVPLNTLA